MSDLSKEPSLPQTPPRALSAERGAKKVLLYDPIGAPTKGSHDEWCLSFLSASIGNLEGWSAEVLSELREPSADSSEFLLLASRSDGRAWPATVVKKDGFIDRLRAMSNWAALSRLGVYGRMPSPSRLIKSPAAKFDVAMKEQWASWWEQAWPSLPVFGTVLQTPRLIVGDENAWAFARPGDHIVAVRGVSPMGLASQLRSVLAARPDRWWDVQVCVGLAWAEAQAQKDGEEWAKDWNALCVAFWEMGEVLFSEGYSFSRGDAPEGMDEASMPNVREFLEPPFCAPDPSGGETFVHRGYARSLVVFAAKAYLPFVPLEEGSWQEPELPGATGARHLPRTGSGVQPKSRSWTPARPKAQRKKKKEPKKK